MHYGVSRIFPAVPLTLEGASVLHQMLRVRWPAWRALAAEERAEILGEAGASLAAMEKAGSAVFSLMGHKGDADAGAFPHAISTRWAKWSGA